MMPLLLGIELQAWRPAGNTWGGPLALARHDGKLLSRASQRASLQQASGPQSRHDPQQAGLLRSPPWSGPAGR